jgi:hypothetical protein
VLKGKKHPNGYMAVCLTLKDGSHKDFLVHRLVCLAFHGAPTREQTDVNHIDHNKQNNRPENLEWCTRSENMRAAVRFGAMDRQRKAVAESNKRRSKPVIGTTIDGKEVVRFESITAARKGGYSKVSNVLSGEQKTAGGLYWRYA